jgi:tetratricopeptide (TPR) repeat protein
MNQPAPIREERSRGLGALHWVALALVLVLAALVAHRVVAVAMADRLADRDPEAALRWNPGHPVALTNLARNRLEAGDPEAARQLARRALAAGPMHGHAFSLLAEVSARAGGPEALELAEAAVRRNPRDLRARARLAEAALARADYDAAIAQLDVILRLSSRQRGRLIPELLTWSAEPDFADALARRIAAGPLWRPAILDAMGKRVSEPPVRALYARLRESGGLSPAETARWLDELMRAGEWGAAYAHWASQAAAGEGALPAVYNGGFEQTPSGSGFDWRLQRIAGTVTTIVPTPGGSGQAARIEFLGRQVAQAGLQQALLLPPGRHRVSMRTRAQGLRSDQGLEWVLECAGEAGVAGRSGRIGGDHGWRGLSWDAVVPAEDCPGQWLRLRNPAPKGTASTVAGTLWIDDVRIVPLARDAAGPDAATTPD